MIGSLFLLPRFSPRAFANPQHGTVVPDVPLLIDTGADVTLLQTWSEHRGDRVPSR